MLNIKQNLFFALVYNAAGVPVAAGVLYPFFGLLVSPIFAAAAMSLSSVSVITNALRLAGRPFSASPRTTRSERSKSWNGLLRTGTLVMTAAQRTEAGDEHPDNADADHYFAQRMMPIARRGK